MSASLLGSPFSNFQNSLFKSPGLTSQTSNSANKTNTTTTSTTPQFNFNLGKGTGTGTLGSSTTAAPASSGPTKPPINTIDTKFEPVKVDLQDEKGATSQGNLMSISGNDKFKQYSLLELRVFDYITQKKIDELPAPPAAPAPLSTASAFNPTSFTASSLLGKATTAGTDANKQYTNKAAENDGLTEKDIQNAQGGPNPIPAKIYTAAEFFKPNVPKLKKTLISEISIRSEEENQFIDYSILFKPRTSSSNRSKSVVAPIVVTAKMLDCGPPLESSTQKFAPSYRDDQINENNEIEGDDFASYSSSKYNLSDGYTTYPPLSKIHLSSSVKNFRISKEEVATIDFLEPVDISKLDFKKDVIIRTCFVDVYRIKKNMPKKGTGLNVRAMINMHSVWPKNETSGIRERTKNPKILSQYENSLNNFCETKEVQLIFYMKDKGILQFLVPDFSNGPFDLP